MPAEMIGTLRARPARKPFELRGWHVLAMFVAFFGIVGAVNATMMSLAIRTMSGLDARNGYDESQGYNRRLAAARAQGALGWSGTASIALAGASAPLVVALADGQGRPVEGVAVVARLQHPSDRKRDREAALEPEGPGRWAGAFADVAPGFRDLVIEARDAADGSSRFISRQRVRLGG